MFRSVINKCNGLLSGYVIPKVLPQRFLSVTCPCHAVEQYKEKDVRENKTGQDYEPADPDTSIRYIHSKAYRKTYGEEPVWKYYRRNGIGHIPPETRLKCVRAGKVATGNPCPICRDQFLTIDHSNVQLLGQFLDPMTGECIPSKMTGICQDQQRKLLYAVAKAQDYGYLEKYLPVRKYRYSEYYKLAGLRIEKAILRNEQDTEHHIK